VQLTEYFQCNEMCPLHLHERRLMIPSKDGSTSQEDATVGQQMAEATLLRIVYDPLSYTQCSLS